MKLTEEQIKFLDKVCYGKKVGNLPNWKLNSNGEVDVDGNVDMKNKKLTEIPVKFGRVSGWIDCRFNYLTTLKNLPNYIGDESVHFFDNPLHNYFKSIKEEDFPHWDKLNWWVVLDEYPFLVNIGKKYMNRNDFNSYLNKYPQTKLYLD